MHRLDEKLLDLLERNPNRPVPMAVIEFELYLDRRPDHPYAAVKAIAAKLRAKIDKRGLTIQAGVEALTLLRCNHEPMPASRKPGPASRFYPGARPRAGR